MASHHSHFLLELVFSPKKPRCTLNQTLSLYFKCYVCALNKGPVHTKGLDQSQIDLAFIRAEC